MLSKAFVGRDTAVAKLTAVLQGRLSASGKLAILSIEGPGGIGKTCLFDHVMQTSDFTPRKYLCLRVDSGGSLLSAGLLPVMSRLLDSARSAPTLVKPAGYYFPAAKRTLTATEAVKARALHEFEGKAPGDAVTKSLFARLLDRALESGTRLNDIIPLSRKYLDARQLQVWQRENLDEIVRTMRAISRRSRWLGGILPDVFSVALENAVKDNVCKALSDALLSDLSAILSGYRRQDVLKPRHGKVPGIDRLLLVIDDYEALSNHLRELLVCSLLPSLRSASFPSVVVIPGRDQLEATHWAWDQHLRGALVEKIPLEPLQRGEMDALVQAHGVSDAQEKERAWRDTGGYPYSVQLWIEELRSGGRTAVMLKRFYDRTTRLLSEAEKRWLDGVIFLDEVNKRTLRGFLPDEQEVEDAYRWFENDGSVRDTTTKVFRVREYLRSRLIDYLRVKDPDRCDDLTRKCARSGSSG